MKHTEEIIPTRLEQVQAKESHEKLVQAISHLKGDVAEIEIEETEEKIRLPVRALYLLTEILDSLGNGQPISVVPIATEVTTQAAADIIGCSRPYIVKLLEEGKIPFVKIGRHRRIKYQDVIEYRRKMKLEQEKVLTKMMKADEDSGLYDS